MNKATKIITSVLVGIIVVLFVYILVHPTNVIQLGGAPSPTGSTGGTQLVAQQVFANTTTTWASFFNNSYDRIVDTVYYANIAGGTTTVTLQLATSSTSDFIRDVNGAANTNFLFNALVGNTSNYLASTTPSNVGTSSALRLWPAGSYLNFQGATGTMTGIVGVRYFQN